MQRRTWVKICGVTLPEDIELLGAVGADAVGFNFIPRSKRRVDVARAAVLSKLARGKLERVGVVEDLEEPAIRDLMERVELDRIQLHGNESDELLARLGSIAYRAVGIATTDDVARAAAAPGGWVLVDTKVGGTVGGTGQVFDWDLIVELCRARNVIVAGGLGPENVRSAVQRLRPFGIDVASGVERPGQPGQKDPELVRQFVAKIRDGESSTG